MDIDLKATSVTHDLQTLR